MPEVNEIRKYADFIKKKMRGKDIIRVKILNGRYKKHGPFEKYDVLKENLPIKIKDVKTKGKFMYVMFEYNLYMFATMGLSGGWCYLENDKYTFSEVTNDYSGYMPQEKMDRYLQNAINHRNVEFKTATGSLFYYDVLSFGTLKIIDNKKDLDKKLSSIGPDIMEPDTTFDIFKNRIYTDKNWNKEIGIVIMDQKTISGIGNYLRSDILYISKIDPFKKVKNISEKELKAIYNNSKILTWGVYDIAKGRIMGVIKKNTKLPSDYGKLFYVYREDVDINGYNVLKIELYEGSQKRFIYYVPEVQKPAKNSKK